MYTSRIMQHKSPSFMLIWQSPNPVEKNQGNTMLPIIYMSYLLGKECAGILQEEELMINQIFCVELYHYSRWCTTNNRNSDCCVLLVTGSEWLEEHSKIEFETHLCVSLCNIHECKTVSSMLWKQQSWLWPLKDVDNWVPISFAWASQAFPEVVSN